MRSVGGYGIGREEGGEEDFKWLGHLEVRVAFSGTVRIDFGNDGKEVMMNGG